MSRSSRIVAVLGILATWLIVQDGIDEIPVVGLTALNRDFLRLRLGRPWFIRELRQVLLPQFLREIAAAVMLRLTELRLRDQHELSHLHNQHSFTAHDVNTASNSGIALIHIDIGDEPLRILEQRIHHIRHGASIIPAINTTLRYG